MTPEQKAAKIAALTQRPPYTVGEESANSIPEGKDTTQDIPGETIDYTEEEKA